MAEDTLSGLTLFNRGKVRDIYDLGDNLLLVASDRISAFDVILPTLIPDKGKILTRFIRLLVQRDQGHPAAPLDHDGCRSIPRRLPAAQGEA